MMLVAFGNFKRKPEEVQRLVDLTTIVNRFAARVHFEGNQELVSADLRDTAYGSYC